MGGFVQWYNKEYRHSAINFVTPAQRHASLDTALLEKVVWQGEPSMFYNALTLDGKTRIASSPASNSVYVFNARISTQAAIIPEGTAPKGVKVTPDGKFAYVSNQGSANVRVINLENLKVVDIIKVEVAPHNVRSTRDGKLAYVTLQGGAGIGVIDTTKRQMASVIPVPGITGPQIWIWLQMKKRSIFAMLYTMLRYLIFRAAKSKRSSP